MSAPATTAPANSTEFGNNPYAVLASQTGSSESAESAETRAKIHETLLSFEISIGEIKSIREKFSSDNEVRHNAQNILVQANKIYESVKNRLTEPELSDATYEAVKKNSGELDALLVRISDLHAAFMSVQKSFKKATAEASKSTFVTPKSAFVTPKSASEAPEPVIATPEPVELIASSFEQIFESKTYIDGASFGQGATSPFFLTKKSDVDTQGMLPAKFFVSIGVLNLGEKPNTYILCSDWRTNIGKLTFKHGDVPADAPVSAPVKASTEAPAKVSAWALDQNFKVGTAPYKPPSNEGSNVEVVDDLSDADFRNMHKYLLLVFSEMKKKAVANNKTFSNMSVSVLLPTAASFRGSRHDFDNTAALLEKLQERGIIGKKLLFGTTECYSILFPTTPAAVNIKSVKAFPPIACASTNTNEINISAIGVRKTSVGGSSASRPISSANVGSSLPSKSREILEIELQILEKKLQMLGGL